MALPSRLSRVFGAVSALAFGMAVLFGLPTVAAAQGQRFAVVIQGASGEEQYAKLHREWLDALVGLLRDRFKYDAAHLTVLSEEARAGEQKATAENARAVFARLATTTKAADQLVVVFIGHGTVQGPDAKFNLIGPDLSVADWNAVLKPVAGRLAVVDTTSGSFAYLAGLSAPGRVVITATASPAQTFHTMFPDGFVKAFTTDAADLDKNGRISLLEAFTFAARSVAQHYQQAGTMATETSMLDDDGDGKGRLATATGGDGAVAGSTYLEGVTIPGSSDPEVQQWFIKRQALTDQIDDLRRRQKTITAEEFDREFERLVIDLAVVSRDIRRRTGGSD